MYMPSMKNIIKTLILKISLLTLIVNSAYTLQAQDQKVKVVAVGFYNLENLFDTVDDPDTKDEEFTPEGSKAWTQDKYEEKISNMAYVISQMGAELTNSGMSILGVSEIENRKVLEDLISQGSLASNKYQIVHHESPDFRGIDVALIYNPAHYKVHRSKAIAVDISEPNKTRTTRDILHVEGELDGDPLHVLVNHWPSRRGGEQASAWKRNKAAKMCKHVVDSLYQIDPNIKVIIMGDLNDDPTSASVTSHLMAVGDRADLRDARFMYNPYMDIYRRGLGSNAYRDAWSLFDQIILSANLTDEDNGGYFYYKGQVFNKKYLIQRSGKYKGYPMRTFSFDKYQGGYSDHFPSLVYLVKKI